MEKYRGDTFIFAVNIEQDGETSTFKVGDVVRFGMKKSVGCKEYILYQEIVVEEEAETIEFTFASEETSKLDVRAYQIEIELTRDNIVETVYRDTLEVLGDVVNGEA